MTSYDLSPATANSPLGVEEVEALLGADARALLRDAAAARTLLLRVRATLRHDQGEMKRLRTDVARMAEGYKMKASPLTAAVEALGRLSPDEQAEVFNVHATAVLEALRAQIAQARTVRLAAESARRRTVLVLSRLLESGNLGAAEASLVSAELAALQGRDLPVIPEVTMPRIADPVAVAPAAEPGSLADIFS